MRACRGPGPDGGACKPSSSPWRRTGSGIGSDIGSDGGVCKPSLSLGRRRGSSVPTANPRQEIMFNLSILARQLQVVMTSENRHEAAFSSSLCGDGYETHLPFASNQPKKCHPKGLARLQEEEVLVTLCTNSKKAMTTPFMVYRPENSTFSSRSVNVRREKVPKENCHIIIYWIATNSR